MTINVGIEFQVSRSREISQATKRLVKLGTATKSYAKDYDLLSAARNRDHAAQKKYAAKEKELLLIQKKSKLSHHALGALVQKHTRMLRQYRRELDENVKTDKRALKLAKEQEKQDLALVKSTAKLKAEHLAVRESYDHLAKATRLFEAKQVEIEDAFEGIKGGGVGAAKALDMLTKEYLEFVAASKSGGVVDAGNQFARYGDQAYRAAQRTKRFASVGLQQAGYQVNDFIVQIASGQNALVAFGQQGSQLAGIFGPAGAVVGALIAGAAALGNLIYQSHKATANIKTLKEALEELGEATESLQSAYDSSTTEALSEDYGHLAETMVELQEIFIALETTVLNTKLASAFKAVGKESAAGFLSSLKEMVTPEEFKYVAQLIGDSFASEISTALDLALLSISGGPFFPARVLQDQLKEAQEKVRLEDFSSLFSVMTQRFEGDFTIRNSAKYADDVESKHLDGKGGGGLANLFTKDYLTGFFEAMDNVDLDEKVKLDSLKSFVVELDESLKDLQVDEKALSQDALKQVLQYKKIIEEVTKAMAVAQKADDDLQVHETGENVAKNLNKIREQILAWIKDNNQLAIKAEVEVFKERKQTLKEQIDPFDPYTSAKFQPLINAQDMLITVAEATLVATKEREKTEKLILSYQQEVNKLVSEDHKGLRDVADTELVRLSGIIKELEARLLTKPVKESLKKDEAKIQAVLDVDQQGMKVEAIAAMIKLGEDLGVTQEEVYKRTVDQLALERDSLDAARQRLVLVQSRAEAEGKALGLTVAGMDAWQAYTDKTDEQVRDHARGLRKQDTAQEKIEATLSRQTKLLQDKGKLQSLQLKELKSTGLEWRDLTAAEQFSVALAGRKVRLANELIFSVGGLTEKEKVLIVAAEDAAESLAMGAIEIERAKTAAKELSDIIRDMDNLDNKILNFGVSLAEKIRVAKAELEALQTGEDPVLAKQTERELVKATNLLAEQQRLYGSDKPSTHGLSNTTQEQLDVLERTRAKIKALEGKLKAENIKPKGEKDPLGDLEKELIFKNSLLGVDEDRQKVLKKIQKEMSEDPTKYTQEQIDAVVELAKEVREAAEAYEELNSIASSVADSFGDAFTSMVDGTKSVKSAFKDMARAIVEDLWDIFVIKKITGFIESSIRSISSPGHVVSQENVDQYAKGGVVDPYSNVVPFSTGGVFSSPVEPFSTGGVVDSHVKKVLPFAKGGVFSSPVEPFATGGVVNSPTYFPMNEGKVGLMGEAGPEAIMPLERGADGKLGVQAHGNGSSNVVIHQNFNFTANGDDSVKRIIAQAAPQIAQMTKSSLVNDRRRGGQMKATFG